MCLDLLHLDDLTGQEPDGPPITNYLVASFSFLIEGFDGTDDISSLPVPFLSQSIRFTDSDVTDGRLNDFLIRSQFQTSLPME